jgi:hypothetical protein
MKIQFGTRLTSCHAFKAFFLGFSLCIIGVFNVCFHNFFGKWEKSILQSRNINVTRRLDVFFCDLPYDDCLCSVLSNKSDTSDNCITYAKLVASRFLPLVSFILQIFLIRELFSFNADRPRVGIYALWIASIFTFIGLTISIYWSSCYHAYISFILYVTGLSLALLSMHNSLVVHDHLRSSFNCNQIVVVQKSEKDNKGDKSWQELI